MKRRRGGRRLISSRRPVRVERRGQAGDVGDVLAERELPIHMHVRETADSALYCATSFAEAALK